jgi:hypothetical protein
VRYGRAVSKLRTLAQGCDSANFPSEEPFLRDAYVFGDVLKGVDPVEHLEVALVLNLAPEQVPWRSHPRGTVWLVQRLRLDRQPIAYCWRSHLMPVWNHHIRGPVRFWSLDGPDEDALQALAERRFDDLGRVIPDPGEERTQIAAELDLALRHLRVVSDKYWDPELRREHRGFGRYPENTLWEATYGYLELLDASRGRS